MRKIGLVGGTGPESTIMYYKELNSRIDEATCCKSMPELVIESVNFRKTWELVSAEQYKELADYISEKVNCLAKSGAEIITLTAVTMHIVFDEIENNTNVSLVSIPKAVCSEIVAKGYKKVGLLGTIFTSPSSSSCLKASLTGVLLTPSSCAIVFSLSSSSFSFASLAAVNLR